MSSSSWSDAMHMMSEVLSSCGDSMFKSESDIRSEINRLYNELKEEYKKVDRLESQIRALKGYLPT